MKYNKLVRDNIPDIIRKKGANPVTHIANEEEYWQKLKEKLGEEYKEFLESESENELADLLEVINGICEFKGIDKDKIEQLRKDKARERGQFKNRIILDED